MSQRAYLLDQLAVEGVDSQSATILNKQITAPARKMLNLDAGVANRVRQALAVEGHLEASKHGRSISYRLTEAGRAYLASLEKPVLGPSKRPTRELDESAISEEIREAQKAFLLLQLVNADGQKLSRGDANKIPEGLRRSLGLQPATIANLRRAKLAEQGYLRIERAGRSEAYALTPDGLDFLAACDSHLAHAEFKLKGRTLNALIGATRESSFKHDRTVGVSAAERQVPGLESLREAVLGDFQELRQERYARSGLVPIHEVRQRIASRFGPAAARHDVLDEVILGLWRDNRLGLEAISDLGGATQQQVNDGIPGHNGTLFYLEAAREQPVA